MLCAVCDRAATGDTASQSCGEGHAFTRRREGGAVAGDVRIRDRCVVPVSAVLVYVSVAVAVAAATGVAVWL